MFTVTLQYVLDLGPQLPADFVTPVASIDVYELPPPDAGILDLLGMDLVSDVTAVVGTAVVRTIVLRTNAQGDAMYRVASDVGAVTRNLFTGILNLQTPAPVAAAEPVVI